MVERTELVARIKALTGPDPSLDYAIYKELLPFSREEHLAAYASDPDAYWYWMTHRAYTGSLDEAICLAERVIPGVWWQIAKGRLSAAEPLYGAHLLFGPEEIIGEGEGPTAAIAVLLALFDAPRHPRGSASK